MLTIFQAAEIIALKLRRLGAPNEYLYVQIFAGSSFAVASVCLFLLRQNIRQRPAPS
jgi:hypothetical protein